ncbi:hypothetical protein CcI49_33390 [Frankia sp. CcI49]|uniref:Uncharacterized protein n=1 Tax=Parafrankia irregularis TaxID=795642 RepID=A0A0S4QGY7_9ACTN|nr:MULTISPECIES: hypothetical protein [Frankiaceae]EFC86306.1 hypothetical protein FrEUN1fDRAFT_0576 [Parafrankia sp. EUN1f]KPM51429.1 hypothetical protein ACG83_35525 [Frankia sp. R43]MBE3202868.1 hypothetical protein [Parafrankia sp. CH37]ONH52999.1 hypothetical protein CcI49_33390 [Frankia sp. CcI49]CUU54505.1 hypothetical protein Ga0074812_102515 [Parafrankia irregularis]
MSAIRDPRSPTSTGTPKSLEALSASLNRALAGARAPQVAAARHADLRGAGLARASARTDRLAARRRTNLLIGTLDRLRGSAAGRLGARQGGAA